MNTEKCERCGTAFYEDEPHVVRENHRAICRLNAGYENRQKFIAEVEKVGLDEYVRRRGEHRG